MIPKLDIRLRMLFCSLLVMEQKRLIVCPTVILLLLNYWRGGNSSSRSGYHRLTNNNETQCILLHYCYYFSANIVEDVHYAYRICCSIWRSIVAIVISKIAVVRPITRVTSLITKVYYMDISFFLTSVYKIVNIGVFFISLSWTVVILGDFLHLLIWTPVNWSPISPLATYDKKITSHRHSKVVI